MSHGYDNVEYYVIDPLRHDGSVSPFFRVVGGVRVFQHSLGKNTCKCECVGIPFSHTNTDVGMDMLNV